jgi:hypothetical protein
MTSEYHQQTTKFSRYECDGYSLQIDEKTGRWKFVTPENVALASFPSTLPPECLAGLVDIHVAAVEAGKRVAA